MATLNGPSLRERIANGDFITAIGVHDALSARQVEAAGFECVYVGSYSTEASALGLPDLSMMSRDHRVQIARNVVNAVSVPVIVDIEEGYGNALNVAMTVREFEAAGVSGLQIDDEVAPGKCPFLPGIPANRLIGVREMEGRIAAAVDARRSRDTLIIARPDVIATMSREDYRRTGAREQAADRANAYLAAGADAVFIMALDHDDLAFFRNQVGGPLVGVFAPAEPLPISAFKEAGYQMTIGTLVSLYASIRGVAAALARLKATGDWNQLTDCVATDEEFFNLVNLGEFAGQYHRYGVE